MRINEIIDKIVNYIEEHFCEEIEMKDLSKLVGVNEFIMNQLFSYTCNISISGYIRNRRLSSSAYDLMSNHNVLNVVLKYGYENATSFSRAFEKFHGIKPNKVKKLDGNLKNYPIIHLNIEDNNLPLSYKIFDGNDMVLYGKCVRSDEKHINKDAPEFWSYMN